MLFRSILEQIGCKVIQTKSTNNLVDLKEVLQRLGEMELTNILVEGGSKVITSIIEDQLADKIIIFVAPIIIGGEGAKSPVLGKGINKICEAAKIIDVIVRRFSNDVVIEGTLNYR